MKKIAAITMFVLTTATPVYSYAADPCEVVLCMYGKATGNSGGGECRSAEKAFFNIIKKKNCNRREKINIFFQIWRILC